MDMECPFSHEVQGTGSTKYFMGPDFERGHPRDFPCGEGGVNMARVRVDYAASWACQKAYQSYVDPTKSGKR